jgi:hypothetical protein
MFQPKTTIASFLSFLPELAKAVKPGCKKPIYLILDK